MGEKEPKEKTHVCSIRLDTELYGWLIRYCSTNDFSMSQAMRRALKFYRYQLERKEKSDSEKAKNQ